MKDKKIKIPHDIGRKAIGGFAGHKHTHSYGKQFCFNCGLSLEEIIKKKILNCDERELSSIKMRRKKKPTKKQIDDLINLLKKKEKYLNNMKEIKGLQSATATTGPINIEFHDGRKIKIKPETRFYVLDELELEWFTEEVAVKIYKKVKIERAVEFIIGLLIGMWIVSLIT